MGPSWFNIDHFAESSRETTLYVFKLEECDEIEKDTDSDPNIKWNNLIAHQKVILPLNEGSPSLKEDEDKWNAMSEQEKLKFLDNEIDEYMGRGKEEEIELRKTDSETSVCSTESSSSDSSYIMVEGKPH